MNGDLDCGLFCVLVLFFLSLWIESLSNLLDNFIIV